MRFADYSPPSTPTPDQQLDALKKGLGRAKLWAGSAKLDDGPLLAACVRDLRHDQDLDEPRSAWIWSMVEDIGAVDRFRVPILRALDDLPDPHDAYQLCDFAGRHAEAGDDRFRARLYEIVEQRPFAGRHWLSDGVGEGNLIDVDGEAGFLFVARRTANRLAGRDWNSFDDGYLIHVAIEQFGEPRVGEVLSGDSDPALVAYREGWDRFRRTEAEERERRASRKPNRLLSVDEILAAAGGIVAKFNLFSNWGRWAAADDLMPVHQRLCDTREPFEMLNLFALFSRRAFPRFDTRLIDLCRHADAEIRRRAIQALALISHPRVREFALELLLGKSRANSVIALFVMNYEPGDDRHILDAIELPDDADARHSPLIAVIDALEANPSADRSELGIMAYAETPCEYCRWKAIKLLHDPLIAPEWLTEECRADSYENARRYAHLTTRFRRPRGPR